MKKIICIISDKYKNYIFDLYLLKIKGDKITVISKVPLAIEKKSITNITKITEFRYLMLESLKNYRYLNVHMIISINTNEIIRDEFVFPLLSKKECKKAIEYEITRRYNINHVTYCKVQKENKQLISNVIILKEEFKKFIDEIFIHMPYNIKGITFLSETIHGYIQNKVQNKYQVNSYMLLTNTDNNYILYVIKNNNLIYSINSFDKDIIVESLLSVINYFKEIVTNKLFVIGCINILGDLALRNINYEVIEINSRVDINSLVCRNNNSYERI